MSTLQLKNIPEKTKRKLRSRARNEGMSMSEYVRKLIERDLNRPTREEMLARLRSLPPITSARTAAEDVEDARREREEELGW